MDNSFFMGIGTAAVSEDTNSTAFFYLYSHYVSRTSKLQLQSHLTTERESQSPIFAFDSETRVTTAEFLDFALGGRESALEIYYNSVALLRYLHNIAVKCLGVCCYEILLGRLSRDEVCSNK
jgi:hypothetical protein